MSEPLITIHRPQRDGDRWIGRVDIHAMGEKIELQATASDRLAKQAQHWYARAAEWLDREVAFRGFDMSGPHAPCRGVFCDVPYVARDLASVEVPRDADIERAAELFQRSMQGHPEALEQVALIARAAAVDPVAADALAHLEMVLSASTERHHLPLHAIVQNASYGDPDARKALAALHATSPDAQPVRLSWHQDDYLQDRSALSSDLQQAANAQIGRRLMGVTDTGFERVRPSLHHRAESEAMPMPRTYEHSHEAYAS